MKDVLVKMSPFGYTQLENGQREMCQLQKLCQ